MLARVPIISAYDPSREIMLAYASPSNKIAIMITGLVIDYLGTIPQILSPLFHSPLLNCTFIKTTPNFSFHVLYYLANLSNNTYKVLLLLLVSR